jgi:hypothetical protein
MGRTTSFSSTIEQICVNETKDLTVFVYNLQLSDLRVPYLAGGNAGRS